MDQLTSQIVFRDQRSVEAAVALLWNDEHINAALKSGIIALAVLITFQRRLPSTVREEMARARNHFDFEDISAGPWGGAVSPTVEDHTIRHGFCFLRPNDCGDCKRSEHSECHRLARDRAIESPTLDGKLAVIRRARDKLSLPFISDYPYVLDIDLDYFTTERSISPLSPQTFVKMVRDATAITVAKEPDFVQRCKLDAESINSEMLLGRLLTYIENSHTVDNIRWR
jgi:hypothetical protein